MTENLKNEIEETGNWLLDKLRREGCDEKRAHDICFATGQRQAMLDPGVSLWDPAHDALDRYRRGDWDTPGPELADRLMRDKFGDPMDADKIVEWVFRGVKV